MKTVSLLITFILAIHFTAIAQETPLILFDEDTISLEEFERVYTKNNGEGILNKSSVDEYLDLYVNFRRKVMQAEALGLDTLDAFIQEFTGYRNQLAQPYFTIDEVKDELYKEAYERMKTEIRARHILIKSLPTDSPEDTLKAYNKIMKLRKRALKGESFEDLAVAYSEDPSAKENKGDLGYFSVFYMVYPFETAAYNTDEGEISMPVKTKYGYHILKVEDKRPSKGRVQVSHILISKAKKGEGDIVLNAKQKAEEVYNKLINEDADFADMARKFSDDRKTAGLGGIMQAFGVGKMLPLFEKKAFDLKEKGDITPPFKTEYGWHIIKLENKFPVQDYESLKKEIAEKVRKDARSLLTEEAIIHRIKTQYDFKEYPKSKKEFYHLLDSNYFKSTWKLPEEERLDDALFSINDKIYSQKDFAEFLLSRMRTREAYSIETLVNARYTEFLKKSLREYKDSQLENEYPEFAALVQEYHDGILLFNLTDATVWTKAIEDTTGLENFYNSNKDQYMWGERAKAIIYTLQDSKMAKKARKMVSKKDSKGYTTEDILNKINEDSQLNLKVQEDVYSKNENSYVDSLWKVGISENFEKNGEIIFVEILEIQEPRHQTIDELRGKITSDYQEYLEEKWMEELEKIYPVSINEVALKKLKSDYN